MNLVLLSRSMFIVSLLTLFCRHKTYGIEVLLGLFHLSPQRFGHSPVAIAVYCLSVHKRNSQFERSRSPQRQRVRPQGPRRLPPAASPVTKLLRFTPVTEAVATVGCAIDSTVGFQSSFSLYTDSPG